MAMVTVFEVRSRFFTVVDRKAEIESLPKVNFRVSRFRENHEIPSRVLTEHGHVLVVKLS